MRGLATIVVAEPAIRAGLTTSDGWHVTFDEFLIFDEFASADGDRDITLEELNGVSLNEDHDYATLAGRLYFGLVPAVPRFGNTHAYSADPPEDEF